MAQAFNGNQEELCAYVKELMESLSYPFTKKEIHYAMVEISKILKTTDSEMILLFLLVQLEEEILSFQYEKDYTYFSSFFGIIECYFNKYKESGSTIMDVLTRMQEELIYKMETKPGKYKKSHVNYQVLKKTLKEIQKYIVFFDEKQKKALYNQEKFLSYLFFKKKNLSSILPLLKRNPKVLLLKDEQGVLLLDKIFMHYQDAITDYANKGTVCEQEELLYYDDLIRLTFEKNGLSEKQLKIVKEKGLIVLKTILLSLEDKNYLNRRKMYLYQLIDDLFSFFIGEEKIEDYRSLCERFNIVDAFPTKVQKETERLSHPLREPLDSDIHEVILTIDGENAHEIDDGLSCQKLTNGNYLLGIHIADPLKYLPLYSRTMEEASKRSTSIYIDHQVIPMFPKMLSSYWMSLLKDDFRYARSFYFEMKPNGEVEKDSFRMKRQMVLVYDNLTYDQVDMILKEGSYEDSRVLNSLILLNELAQKRYNPTMYNAFFPLPYTSSTMMVEEMMLFLNRYMAEYFLEKGYPYLYRNHVINETDHEKLARFKNEIAERSFRKSITELEQSMERAFYSTHNEGHWALGYKAYSHVSSPLRRYPDILAHYSMDVVLQENVSDQKIYELEKLLTKKCKPLNSKIRLANDFSRQAETEQN